MEKGRESQCLMHSECMQDSYVRVGLSFTDDWLDFSELSLKSKVCV